MKNVSIDGGNDWGGLGRTDGGNCAEGKGEAHGAKKATRVAQGGTTGKGGSFGPTRMNGDGNEPATGEKHGNQPDRKAGGQGLKSRQSSMVADPKHGSKMAEYVRPSQRF
jgi:hypothetical protein